MLYKTLSAAVYGIDANIIQVEVDCSGIKCDQDHFHTVGLPDAAVRESRDRVRAALAVDSVVEMLSFDFVSMALSPLVLADDCFIVATTVGTAAAAHCDDGHKKAFPAPGRVRA